jgi:hypothetical protein
MEGALTGLLDGGYILTQRLLSILHFTLQSLHIRIMHYLFVWFL